MNGRRAISWKGGVLACGVCCCLTAWSAADQEQAIPGKVKGFRVPTEFYPPPHQSQMKTLVEGGEAQPLPGGRVAVTAGKLQRFREDGSQELLVQAPECEFDPGTKSVASTGRLEAQTGDGKFFMAGEGFLWQQTNSTLTISNRVQTRVHAEALKDVAGSSPAPGASTASEVFEIASDRFSYNAESGLGIYAGNVRVSGTNLNLAGGRLTIKMPAGSRQLQEVVAEEDVSLDYTVAEGSTVHATGRKAVYSTGTGLVHVSGNPAWKWDQREGRGDEFIIDRTNKVLQATGNAQLRLPGQKLGAAAFPGLANPPAALSGSGTNKWVDIHSASYEIRTNRAVFAGPVRVEERAEGTLQGTLECRFLTASFAGTNSLTELVAEDQVVIRQGTNHFGAGKAVYTATNSLLELIDHPVWQAGLRSGKGGVIRVDGVRNVMSVHGNASMRFPAAELSGLTGLGTGTGTGARLVPKAGAGEFAEIFSEDYELRPQGAVFRGGVYISHPRVNWASETLSIALPPEGGKVDRIESDQSVVFDLVDEKGQRLHGTGERAVYRYAVSGSQTNEVIDLKGQPCWLQSFGPGGATNGQVRSPVLLVDLARHKFVVPPGDWSIRGVAPAPDTNLFRLPERRRLKP